ncbi:hypothetical protein F4604DRAFT_1688582 [Suillus subluteus]|nr:hypothetical protein F4604DRAFT_1688582 [Suillus subluteus]
MTPLNILGQKNQKEVEELETATDEAFKDIKQLKYRVIAIFQGHLREKVIWFHSGMTMDFRVNAMEKLRKGELWGICCTDAAGMGLDLRDVKIIVQWGVHGITASGNDLQLRKTANERNIKRHQTHSQMDFRSGVENDREDMADSETEGGEDSTEAQIEMVAATDSLSCLREDTQQETTADVWLFPDSLDNAARIGGQEHEL